ncbi:MAG: XkdX family protein [Lachnospiraceae bacterium]|nr:XkdX family protein [Lachnospiraceae bacterium]
MHSNKYETVKRYYSLKLWDVTRVRNAVVKGWITEAEFAEITGEAY